MEADCIKRHYNFKIVENEQTVPYLKILDILLNELKKNGFLEVIKDCPKCHILDDENVEQK